MISVLNHRIRGNHQPGLFVLSFKRVDHGEEKRSNEELYESLVCE